MIILGTFSFNNGKKFIENKYPHLIREIRGVIKNINSEKHVTKKSKEKTMVGKMLYNPKTLNYAFKEGFKKRGWETVRIKCDYPTKYYNKSYKPKTMKGLAFREMDFIKEKLGVEVQFGKYAFMVYNIAAKMTIFRNRGYIDAGVEIVPIKEFAGNMSTGVSYFEQFIWDLENRGVSNIDVPALIFGVGANPNSK